MHARTYRHLFLAVCGLLHEDFEYRDYMASDHEVTDELEKIWRETIFA
jgi:hypothetical protein